jgi:hypothetical protein
MRARGILAALIVVGMALGGLAGCSKKLRPIQNLPPETYVNIQGAVDLVNHRVHLYWYGTDPDGSVAAFAFRWVYPPPASQDPAWVTILPEGGSLRTDSMFTVFTGDSGQVTPRFEIYAIDNEDAADPTPAVQRFLLSNLAPQVVLTDALGLADSTYASATVSWMTIDPDGGGPGLHYRLWLDGSEADYDSTSEQTFTVPSARFLQDGVYRSGARTLYVQAVDDGGRAGEPSAMTWYVRAPAAVLENNQGRLLVIDDVPRAGANNALFDAFYKGIADLLPSGTYDVLRYQYNPGMFRNGRDIAQTFRQFKAVLWYRGGELTVSPWLRAYQDSIGGYLDAGGNLYVDGLYLVEGLRTPGALREEFVTRHMGSTRLIYCYTLLAGGVEDSTAGWSSSSGSAFRSSVYGESFRALVGPAKMTDSTGAMRGFAVTDTNSVALWAMAGQLVPPNVGFEVPVGVTVPQRMNGRLVLLTLPVRFAPPAVATNLLRRMLHDFGIGIPLP